MTDPTTVPAPTLRDRVAEALYPTYGQQDRNRSLAIADAVLAVLRAPVDRATAEERAARWETAALEAGREVDRGALRAYMAVADDEQAELRLDRDLAIAHDRQPYPTAWAYEQACKALRRKEAVIERVLEWAASEAVTAKTEFGNGYRECQRDIRDLLKGRFDDDAVNELRRLAGGTANNGTEATAEDVVREHVTTLHLIGEQLAVVESWMWNHLADVRDADDEHSCAVSGCSGEPDPLRMSEELCPGFPDHCPNLRTIEPNPPEHLGGVRCGCADEPAAGAGQDGAQS